MITDVNYYKKVGKYCTDPTILVNHFLATLVNIFIISCDELSAMVLISLDISILSNLKSDIILLI